MTSQQSHPPGHDPSATDLFNTSEISSPGSETILETQSVGFGSRLRAAREARGLDIASCAHALKLPARVLRQLESDQHDGIDYQVYLGSYITKYGRYLALDEASIQAEITRLRKQGEPVLVATGGISHSRYLLERYATAATYVVLTAVIIVPVIWLGVRGTLSRDISHLAPLDAAPVAQQDLPSARSAAGTAGAMAGLSSRIDVPRSAADDQPLLASMVPSMSGDSLKPTTAETPQPATATATAREGSHSVSLALDDPSWVEITAADGSRLEYGLLPAGAHKTYHSDQSVDVRLGNATGASVSIDGEPMALDAFRHANIAHFRVDVENGKAVPHGG